MKNLLSVAQVVVSSLEVDEVLRDILHSAMAVMDMPAGSVALFDEEGRLRIKAHSGLTPRFTSRLSWPVRTDGLAHKVMEEGRAVAIEDTLASSLAHRRHIRDEGIRSILCVPLMFERKVAGIVFLDDFRPRRFSQQRLEMMDILASFAGMSLEHARLHEHACQLASTDGLTSLYNYRMFRQMVKEEINRTGRYHKPMTLILFDIDNFKLYNDTFGHPAGDRALVVTAEILRESLRECDILFRCGGEEFIALLPETGIEEALIAAERSRHAIEEKTPGLLSEGSGKGLTVSIGVASFPRDGQELESLLKTLDDQLYMAKRGGKNLVHYLRPSSGHLGDLHPLHAGFSSLR